MVNVAFVGAGNMAREHMKAFKDVPGACLSGVYSRSPGRARELAAEFDLEVVADSIVELRNRTRAGLVVVTVPELAANAVAKSCFEYDWAVLLEKPAGYDLADAEDIAAAARQRGRRAYVALNRRYYSSTRSALAALEQDAGGRFIVIQDQEDQAAALAAGQPAAVVEKWMYANAIHLIDYFRVFGRGRITNVEPIVRWDPRKPSVVVAKVDFSSGDVGLYEGVWNGPGPWAVAVTTANVRLEMRPIEQLGVQRRGERRLEAQKLDPMDANFKAGLRLQAERAVAAAKGITTDLPTVEDGLETMRLVSQIFRVESA